MPYTIYPYTQYGGIWKLNAASAAKGAGTWPFVVPNNGNLYSWGLNGGTGGGKILGTLGQNIATYSTSSPAQVGSQNTWSQITIGGGHALAIKTDGTLWSWGQNFTVGFGGGGQLGLGNITSYSSPVQVGSLTTWLNISAGEYHSIGIRTDGTMWSWGSNAYGQLGQNNGVDCSSPKQIGSLTTWKAVSAPYYGGFAIKTDGTLWAWGRNTVGILGTGNTTNYSSPVQIGALTNWLFVTGNYSNAIATKTDGTLWAWGQNYLGQLGLGNTTSYSSPKQVGSLTNWKSAISSTGNNTIALKTDGTLWTWGSNSSGQLGLGNIINYSSPKQVGALTNWSNISSLVGGSIAIKTNGTLWVWGDPSYGQLGLGNTTAYSSPKQVGSGVTWIILPKTASLTDTGMAIKY